MREIFPLEFSPRNPQVKIMNYDKLLLNKNYLSTASFCFPPGFLGFEIFDSGIFLGRKIWQVFFFGWFDLSRDFSGYSMQI